ncbi:MFS transporter [Microbacterium sp. RD1]|uniref:MFS transporter n=1 Tax=Microbacterium sp. RD1 TaxID=3457313 RepID=UPI003FA60280
MSASEVRRVTLSSYLGNTVEMYDFILYGAAAAIFFGPLFFSDLDPALATIASFATFAAGFIARPLGGLVFGRLGDRVGRKPVLLTTLLIMCLSSGAIGLLPTGEAVGGWAALILVTLRVLQGLAVGGEWGGASLMTAEFAPPKWRGLVTSIGQAGLASGGALSSAALALVALLPVEAQMAWGWRIPFLASFVLLLLALYVRLRINESPLFQQMEEESRRRREQRTPVRDVLRSHKRAVLIAIAIALPPPVITAIVGSFAVAYATGAGQDRGTVLGALTTSYFFAIVLAPVYGYLSDRFGRKLIYLVGSIAFALFVFPLFWMVTAGPAVLVYLAFILAFGLMSQAMSAPLAAILSEIFPTAVRYTGISLGFQFASVLAGVFPLIAATLVAAGSGSTFWVSVAMLPVALLATVVMFLARSNRGVDLARVGVRGDVDMTAS